MKNNNSIGKIFFSKWKLLCLFLIAGLQMIQAQNTQIKGVVKADDGEPLPGVTVVLTGTPIGTSTDFDGNYMLNLLDDAKSITFSYLGFKTQTIAYTGQKEINVTLEADRSELEEVVVVGYGTQKAKDVTGAVTKVKAEAVERTTNQTIEQALTGRIAGLNTVSSDGSLGAGVELEFVEELL